MGGMNTVARPLLGDANSARKADLSIDHIVRQFIEDDLDNQMRGVF